LRQLFGLATSVISDAINGMLLLPQETICAGDELVEAFVHLHASPVQKLILYNHTGLNVSRLCQYSTVMEQLTSLVLGGAILPTRHVIALAVAVLQPSCKLQQLVLESCGIGKYLYIYICVCIWLNRTVENNGVKIFKRSTFYHAT
jgi:hypothetical protein